MRLGSNIGHQLSLSIFLFVGVKVSHKHSHFSLFIYFYSISLFPYLPISLCNCFLCFSPLSFFDIRFSTSLSFVIINLCHSLYLLYTLSLSLSTYFCLSPSVWNCISLPLLPLSLFISLSPSLSLFLSIYVPLYLCLYQFMSLSLSFFLPFSIYFTHRLSSNYMDATFLCLSLVLWTKSPSYVRWRVNLEFHIWILLIL